MILTFSTSKREAEEEITTTLREYPQENAFQVLKLEFASIFKNTNWEGDIEEEERQTYHCTPSATSGKVPIGNEETNPT